MNRPPASGLATSSKGLVPSSKNLDGLIRELLGASDPSSALDVAAGLMKRYGDLPRARAIAQESAGLPLAPRAPSPLATLTAAGPTSLDLDQARSDLESDLNELTAHVLLKDIGPELAGWASSIRAAIETGLQAARLALDIHQRDRAFAIRKQLGDFARLARLIGTLSPNVVNQYRSLARSLDEIAAVLLVLMGEALANAGYSGGRYLLPVSASELQTRREAVIYALRNLTGSAQEAYSAQDWPRGLDAYRQLFGWLESHGHGDLRALLHEHEVARIMDGLIERGSHGSSGLRALGATARIELQRFQRLIRVLAEQPVNPHSPPLTALWEALQLFVDAFRPAGGFRLLRIARPAVLSYGVYGGDDADDSEDRLSSLVLQRRQLAGLLDCLAHCVCEGSEAQRQVLLDLILQQLDRAIDLYAVAESQRSAPEIRAAAAGYLIRALLQGFADKDKGNGKRPLDLPGDAKVQRRLERIAAELEIGPQPGAGELKMIQHELLAQYAAEQDWELLVRQLAPACVPDAMLGERGVISALFQLALRDARGGKLRIDALRPAMPAPLETIFSGGIHNTGADGRGLPESDLADDIDDLMKQSDHH